MVSLRYKCSSCYNSFPWLVYVLIQMILTAFILIYLAIDMQKNSHDKAIIVQEISISFLIFVDIVITRLVVGKHVIKDPLWWFDIVCFIGVTIGLCAYGRKLTLVEEDIDLSFVIARYAFQLTRFILYFIKLARAIWKSAINKNVIINEKGSNNSSSNSVSQQSGSKTNDIDISCNTFREDKRPRTSLTNATRSVVKNNMCEQSEIRDNKNVLQEPLA